MSTDESITTSLVVVELFSSTREAGAVGNSVGLASPGVCSFITSEGGAGPESSGVVDAELFSSTSEAGAVVGNSVGLASPGVCSLITSEGGAGPESSGVVDAELA